MNQILMGLFIVFLFFVLTPGVYITIPRRGSKWTVAIVHGLLFAFVLYITHKFVWKIYEGFSSPTCKTPLAWNGGLGCCVQTNNAVCPSGFTNNSGTCYKSGVPTSSQDITKLSKATCADGKSATGNGKCVSCSATLPTCAKPKRFNNGICV